MIRPKCLIWNITMKLNIYSRSHKTSMCKVFYFISPQSITNIIIIIVLETLEKVMHMNKCFNKYQILRKLQYGRSQSEKKLGVGDKYHRIPLVNSKKWKISKIFDRSEIFFCFTIRTEVVPWKKYFCSWKNFLLV